MSPRRNRPRGGAAKRPVFDGRGDDEPGPRYGLQRTEAWRGEDWVVRLVGGTAGKRYRCPGCDQEIQVGVPHVVAWPQMGQVDDRRHWHKACWGARERRGPRF